MRLWNKKAKFMAVFFMILSIVRHSELKAMQELTHVDEVISVTELDSDCLATLCIDGYVTLWEPEKKQGKVSGYKFMFGISHGKRPRELVRLPEAKLAVLLDNKAVVWGPSDNPQRYEEMGTLKHGDVVTSIIALKNGDLATSSHDKTVKVWKPIEGDNYKCVATLIHDRMVDSVIKLKNGNLAARVVEWNKRNKDRWIPKKFDVDPVRVWKPNADGEYELVSTLVGHTDWVISVTELKNGDLATSSVDQTVKVWKPIDGDNYKCAATLKNLGMANSVIELDNDYLATSDSYTVIWQRQKKDGAYISKASFELDDANDYVDLVIKLRDGRLASGIKSNTVRVWEPKADGKYELMATLEGHTGLVTSIIGLKNDNLATSSRDKTVKVWDLRDKDEKGKINEGYQDD